MSPAMAAEDAAAQVLRRLTVVWTGFEARLEATPLIRRLTRGRFELADYHAFLVQLRQQVKDGALWMARAASNVDEAHLELRSALLRHAVTEHRDFRLLEADYLACGGDLQTIRGAPPNLGSEALSAFMFNEASRPNPFGLLGAMFVIEGLGSLKASEWAARVRARLDLPSEAVRFLSYHGHNDDDHLQVFAAMLAEVAGDPATAARIVRVAEVVARLYVLQIEEIAA